MQVNLWIVLAVQAGIFLIGFMGFALWRMLLKNEKLEKKLIEYESYVDSLSSTIEQSSLELHELDKTGMFEADDEIGFVFTDIKNIYKNLNQFKINKNV